MKPMKNLLLSAILFLGSTLQAQETPMSLNLILADPENVLSSDESLGISASAEAAVHQWAKKVYGVANIPVTVEIQIVSATNNGRANAGAQGWELVEYNEFGLGIHETCASFKLRKGLQSNRCPISDIIINLPIEYIRSSAFLNPTPEDQTVPVPLGKIDLVTILAHEIGHGLGMHGNLDPKTGGMGGWPVEQLNGISVYDSLIANPETDTPTFKGQATTVLLGSPMAIYKINGETNVWIEGERGGATYKFAQQPSQNLYHYGRFSSIDSDPDEVFFGLMSGSWTYRMNSSTGTRFQVGEIEFAILKDLGVPVRSVLY
jgi:hypothetical protein